MQERDGVGVGELLCRRIGSLAETDCEHRGTQRVLERLTGAQVGREGERADDLGGPDRLLDRGRHRQDRELSGAMSGS